KAGSSARGLGQHELSASERPQDEARHQPSFRTVQWGAEPAPLDGSRCAIAAFNSEICFPTFSSAALVFLVSAIRVANLSLVPKTAKGIRNHRIARISRNRKTISPRTPKLPTIASLIEIPPSATRARRSSGPGTTQSSTQFETRGGQRFRDGAQVRARSEERRVGKEW